MRAADLAVTDGDGGGDELGQAEMLEPRAHADHVGDRVERADLVEVHVLRVGAVDRRLGHGEPLEGCLGAGPDSLVERGVREQGGDVAPGPVGRAVGHLDVAAGRAEPVAQHGFRRQRDVLGCDGGDRGGHHVERDAGVEQGAEQHVAARARGRVHPADHASPSGWEQALRATRAANTPAP